MTSYPYPDPPMNHRASKTADITPMAEWLVKWFNNNGAAVTRVPYDAERPFAGYADLRLVVGVFNLLELATNLEELFDARLKAHQESQHPQAETPVGARPRVDGEAGQEQG